MEIKVGGLIWPSVPYRKWAPEMPKGPVDGHDEERTGLTHPTQKPREYALRIPRIGGPRSWGSEPKIQKLFPDMA